MHELICVTTAVIDIIAGDLVSPDQLKNLEDVSSCVCALRSLI